MKTLTGLDNFSDLVYNFHIKPRRCGVKLLFIADVVGKTGLDAVCRMLPGLIGKYSPDLTVINGENVARGNGILPDEAERLRYAGADVVTLGNHAFRQTKVYDFLDDCPWLIRPANYPSAAHGKGVASVDTPKGKACVISLAGQIGLEPVDNPFYCADRILKSLDPAPDFIFVDFHAEATSEKRALGYYLDGRVNAVFGTHTHVQTADEQILPKGTGYITDAGMTGAADSVLGVRTDRSINLFLTREYSPFEQAEGRAMLNGVFFDSDDSVITRINLKD